MTFEHPAVLAGLALLPLAVVLYARRERSAGGGREAFASPALAASVAPSPPRWRRHIPLALYALALAALLLAVARPRVTVAVPVEQARVMLVTDQSGSMAARDVPPTRLDAARSSARRLLERLPAKVQVGAIAFNHSARVLAAPTTDRATLRTALATLQPRGGTATGDALALALDLVLGAPAPGGRRPPAAIVLISDGKWVRGRDPIAVAREAARARIPVHTISLGTATGTIEVPHRDGRVETRPVPPDHASLAAIAAASGGRAFTAADVAALDAVYVRLGSQIATRERAREITAGVAGGALALVVIAGALSLLWFGRVP